MEIIKLAVFVLLVLLVVNSIPTFSREITMIITFSCCIVVLLYILKAVYPAVEYIKNVTRAISFSGIDVVFKASGIGLITQFVSDIASDSGNKALANQMVFAGRVCILLAAMPVVIQIVEIIGQLI